MASRKTPEQRKKELAAGLLEEEPPVHGGTGGATTNSSSNGDFIAFVSAFLIGAVFGIFLVFTLSGIAGFLNENATFTAYVCAPLVTGVFTLLVEILRRQRK